MATNYIDLNKLKRFMGYLYKRFLPLSGGVLTGTLKSNSDISTTGNVTANKVINAIWNDYAEYFPRGEKNTEPGDIIALDMNNEKEVYVKASLIDTCIVGIQSNAYGHLIGGEIPPNNISFEEYNIKKYIPIALSGRVNCKVIGIINKGDHIGLSGFPGIGKTVDKSKDYVGIALENKYNNDLSLIKVKVR